MTIEIDNRLWNEFSIWAKANELNDNDMIKYVVDAFRNKFNLDKYGDLNEKLNRRTNEITTVNNDDVTVISVSVVPEEEPKPDAAEPNKPIRRTKVLKTK